LPKMLPPFLLLPRSRVDTGEIWSCAEEDAEEDGLGNIILADCVAVGATWDGCAAVGGAWVAGGAVVGFAEVQLGEPARLVGVFFIGVSCKLGSLSAAVVAASNGVSQTVPVRGCRCSVVLAGGA